MHLLHVKIASQSLTHFEDDKMIRRYLVSTGQKGVGEIKGSNQTPRGRHIIRAKIGQNQPINTIFQARRPVGLWTQAHQEDEDKDWILTRILWLSGLEVGFNRLGHCDSMQRFIYIHGCPDTKPMGIPLSKGCIRMRNEDIIELFDKIPVGTPVFIEE